MDPQVNAPLPLTPKVVIQEIKQLLCAAPPEGHKVNVYDIELVISSSTHLDCAYAAWWTNGGHAKLRQPGTGFIPGAKPASTT